MLSKCELLLSLPDMPNLIFKRINNNNYFDNCKLLSSLHDILNKIKNTESIYNICISLLSLPDILKWNTKNAIDMGNIFNKAQITFNNTSYEIEYEKCIYYYLLFLI